MAVALEARDTEALGRADFRIQSIRVIPLPVSSWLPRNVSLRGIHEALGGGLTLLRPSLWLKAGPLLGRALQFGEYIECSCDAIWAPSSSSALAARLQSSCMQFMPWLLVHFFPLHVCTTIGQFPHSRVLAAAFVGSTANGSGP